MLLILACCIPATAEGQILPTENQKEFVDSLKHELEFGPYFGLYKDNYFTVGIPTNHRPNSHNSNVKFQISLAIRLTEATLPWNSFLFLSYSQKCIWNVFEESLPMRDLNYNPAIGWSKPFFNKDRYIGKLSIMLEHESNGRDSIQSRSWNKVSFSGSALIDEQLMVHAKFWIPIIDGENNKDILKYCGIFQTGVVVKTNNKKCSFALTLVKRSGFKLNFNTIFDFTYQPSLKSPLNIFAQYYNGYGENLLDYNQYRSQFRVGILFRPKFFSEY